MAANKPSDTDVSECNVCVFEWDDTSQLYFHASTGFYHDPNAGWYYSTSDGLYYKFENGNYVLLESDKGHEAEMNQCQQSGPDNATGNQSFTDICSLRDGNSMEESKPHQSTGATSDDPQIVGSADCINSNGEEYPPPPSEWIEETLINLYLSGDPNSTINAVDDVATLTEIDKGNHFPLSTDEKTCTYELEEGEWILEDCYSAASGIVQDEGASLEEENWRAQYGQVSHLEEEPMTSFLVVDMWDWDLLSDIKQHRNVARLVGRLVRRSSKFHPSVPCRRSLYKTAPICEVYLDLVRVTSGKVYKLKSPSAKYLASLSVYDSSNPTKDWGFPELSLQKQILPLPNSEPPSGQQVLDRKDLSKVLDQFSSSEKSNREYRDRAAERRALHGGFGVGPGQKKSPPLSPVPSSAEQAMDEALTMSFGAGSYARKILENMGWKEGEPLGGTRKGLLEPLQAVGNKGNAGLGWSHGLRKFH